MKSAPSSTARRTTRMHSARSAGSPQMPEPVSRMAPNPSRCTVLPAISKVPDLCAVISSMPSSLLLGGSRRSQCPSLVGGSVFDRFMPPAAFSAVSGLTRRADGRFTGDVHPAWTIAGKPNGGYLLAMLGRAAAAVSPHPHPIAASAHYLHSPEPGPVEVQVDVLRAGRSASQLRARLVQDGRPCIEALLTTSELVPDTKPHWAGGVPDPGPGRFEDGVRVPPTTPTGLPASIMGQVDLRLS